MSNNNVKTLIIEELDFIHKKIMNNLSSFTEKVPAAVSRNYVYPEVDNKDWTDGFWIGMLHLAQEYCYEEQIENVIQKQLTIFQERLDKNIVLNHHDIGFLYSLSAVADYRENNRETSRLMGIQAADVLVKRYHDKAQIIQAWGDLDDKEQQGRMIIDCNMNLPLLYFAANETGNSLYKEIAKKHIKRAQSYLIRPDSSTFHTFYVDTETGIPQYGKTAQGSSDDSCWSRGQAWGIYGFAISYNHIGDETLLESAIKLADYYIEHLPKDYISFWDLSFNDFSNEERDTSSAAIAACGLLEISKNLPLSAKKKSYYEKISLNIIYSLAKNYTTKNLPYSNGLMTQGVYNKPGNQGVNECTIWGDYFYMEALIRLYKSWHSFW